MEPAATVSLVAPILLLGQAWGRSGIDAAAIGIGSIVLFLLVVARMAGLIRQVEQAAQLEALAQHDPSPARPTAGRNQVMAAEPPGFGRRPAHDPAGMARLAAADHPST